VNAVQSTPVQWKKNINGFCRITSTAWVLEKLAAYDNQSSFCMKQGWCHDMCPYCDYNGDL